jgi:LuxR family transcriptional regulator, maltose regulon positive regulatory protein
MTAAAQKNSAPASLTGERAVVVATKLNTPRVRAQLIDRTALLALLGAAVDRKLTVVSAPAGWGKTTSLAQWVADTAPGPGAPSYGWLSIDPPDNDPVRFWTYVICALHNADPGVGTRALELVSMDADSLRAVLPTLINEVATSSTQLMLILDDYHLIVNQTVHEQMEFLITRMPANLHLVLASRSDPSLPLARLRARGELAELHTEHLRFEAAEAEKLLNTVLHLNLPYADVELLCQRTEGWAAGLYLAALSLGGSTDAGALIATFDGDNRHIADYLMAEVLDAQPAHLRRFLLRTSILRKLSGPLCDAVLNDSDSAAVLEAIERDNLFLVSLDLTRRWYRYHHLFAELLRTELSCAEPELVPILHQRAATWSAAEGLIDAAVYHLLAAGDIAATARYIADHWAQEFNAGGLTTVSGWLDSLPEQTVRQDPRLSVPRAWIAVNEGRADDAVDWINAIEAQAGDDTAAGGTIAAQAVVLHAIHAFKVGDITTSREMARRATTLELGEAPLARSGLYCIYGNALYFSGHSAAAREAYEQAATRAEQIGDRRYRIYALGYLALIAADAGDLIGAERMIRRANGGGTDLAAQEFFVGVMVSMAAATIFDRRGDLSAAAEAVGMALASARQGGAVPEIAKVLLAQADMAGRLGDTDTARACRGEATAMLDRRQGSGMDPVLLAAARARPDVTAAKSAAMYEQLTPKEQQLLGLLATVLSRQEIARQLYVSLNTVKTQQRSLYRKLGADDRHSAVERARNMGLL